MNAEREQLKAIRGEFVAQWGALGTQWGINRTMAQIHALLMTSTAPLSTDEVMEELEISRGNAHTNLKDLVSWGLVRMVVRKGERRDYYEAEKDVWTIFTTVARERKRREIDPALQVLNQCVEATAAMQGPEARAFHDQVNQLQEFVTFSSKMADRVATMKYGPALQWAAKLLG